MKVDGCQGLSGSRAKVSDPEFWTVVSLPHLDQCSDVPPSLPKTLALTQRYRGLGYCTAAAYSVPAGGERCAVLKVPSTKNKTTWE